MLCKQHGASMDNPYFFPSLGTAVVIMLCLCIYSKRHTWSPPDEGTKVSIQEHPSCRAKLQSNKPNQSNAESSKD